MPVFKQPPLGVIPHFIWVEHRVIKITEAMKRYSAAKMLIPIEWIEELENHVCYLKNRR